MFFKESVLPFLHIGQNYLRQLPHFLTSTPFWIIMALIALQYYRMGKIQRHLYGRLKYPVWRMILLSLVYGVIGGFLASIFLVLFGVALNKAGIMYVWLVAIALMMVDARLMCFSYAGGLVSISYLVFGWPEVDVPTIMALVAALHLVESLLIRLNGFMDPLPVAVKNGWGKIVGGFNLQKFWPVPLMALVAIYVSRPLPGSGVMMPDWWPLLKPMGIDLNHPHLVFAMLPVAAGLGYGELAITSSPREKTRYTSRWLAVYSIVLFGLAVLASRSFLFMWLAAVFAPLAHETLVYVGNYREQRGKPLYVPPAVGVSILDILPGTAAERLGLAAGDTITQVNDVEVVHTQHFLDLVHEFTPILTLTVIKKDGKYRRVSLNLKAEEDLGLVLVPDEATINYVENKFRSPLAWVHRMLTGGEEHDRKTQV